MLESMNFDRSYLASRLFAERPTGFPLSRCREGRSPPASDSFSSAFSLLQRVSATKIPSGERQTANFPRPAQTFHADRSRTLVQSAFIQMASQPDTAWRWSAAADHRIQATRSAPAARAAAAATQTPIAPAGECRVSPSLVAAGEHGYVTRTRKA